jgi:hypothetical protein
MWLTTDNGDWVYQQLDPTLWGHADVLQVGWVADAPVVIGKDLATGEPVAWLGEPVTHREVAPWTPVVEMPAAARPPRPERVSRCPALPATVDELLALDTGEGPRCFGSREMTVKGWLKQDQGCAGKSFLDARQMCGLISSNAGGWRPDANSAPAKWLVGERFAGWYLRGTKDAVYGPDIAVYFDPSHTHHPARNGYFAVTGHFDDAASATCDDFVPSSYPMFAPPQAYINECRRHFVVTGLVRLHAQLAAMGAMDDDTYDASPRRVALAPTH